MKMLLRRLVCQEWVLLGAVVGFGLRSGVEVKAQVPGAAPVSSPAQRPTDPRAAEIVKLLEQGMSLRQDGRDNEAAAAFEKAVTQAREVFGPEHLDTARVMTRQAEFLLKSRPDKAASMNLEALSILQRHLPREHSHVACAINDLALAYGRMGRAKEALKLNLENLRVREASLGKEHSHTLTSLHNAAMNYHSLGQWAECAGSLEEWLRRIAGREVDTDSLRLRVYRTIGLSYSHLGRLAEAEKYLELAADHGLAKQPDDEVHAIDALIELTKVYGRMSPPKIDEARRTAEKAIAREDRKPSPNEWQHAAAKSALASALNSSGKGEEAVALLEEAIRIADSAVEGKQGCPYRAESFHVDLVNLYLSLGRFADAEKECLLTLDLVEARLRKTSKLEKEATSLPASFAKACYRTGHREACKARLAQLLAIGEAQVGKGTSEYAALLTSIGLAHNEMGEPEEANRLLRQSVDLVRLQKGPDDPLVAEALNWLGLLAHHHADYAAGESAFVESVRILRQARGDDDISLVLPLANLGACESGLERRKEAEKTLQDAIRIAERSRWAYVSGYNTAQVNLARQYTIQRRFNEAEELLRKANEVTNRTAGAVSQEAGCNNCYLAQLCYAMGRQADAEKYYRLALDIFEKVGGKDSPAVAPVLGDLSKVMGEQGHHAEARQMLDKSAEISNATSGGSQTNRLATLDQTVAAAVQRGDWAEAVKSTTELRRLAHRWLKSVLPGVDPDRWLTFLGSDRWWSLDGSVSVARACASRPEVAEVSAEWILNGKAVAAELLAGQIRQARQSKDPAVGKIVQELREVREKLAHETLDSRAPLMAGSGLRQRERDLARQLGLLTREASSDDDWYTMEEIRKAIPADAVLIDIVRFQPRDWAPKPRSGMVPAEYMAWVIPSAGKGAVRLVPLGPADPIDTAVARSRRALDWASSEWARAQATRNHQWRFNGDTTLTETTRLTTLVWKPLAAAVGNARTLLLSPDGALWLFPWEALPLNPARFLVEDKDIRYVISGRELLDQPSESAVSGGVLFSNPDYELRLTPVEDSNDELLNKMKKQSKSWGLLTGSRVSPLLDAKEETEALADVLDRYLREAPKVYTGHEALESTFKKLPPPRTLVINTHGFFREYRIADRLPTAMQSGSATPFNVRQNMAHNADPRRMSYHPLLRCGLAMAGANHHAEGSDNDDGVLTGLEVLNADLRGTDLVVLLACETGIGAVQDGEGIAGLHQAFQLVGARTIVASLWSIPVKPSCELIREFFDNLAQKQSKGEALRRARIKLIAEQRNTMGLAHPMLWAGMVLIGDGR